MYSPKPFHFNNTKYSFGLSNMNIMNHSKKNFMMSASETLFFLKLLRNRKKKYFSSCSRLSSGSSRIGERLPLKQVLFLNI